MEEIGFGILIGIGLSALKRSYRPALKNAIKIGMTASERLKDALHEGEETFADLVAEVRHERAAPAAAAGAPDPEPPPREKPPASN